MQLKKTVFIVLLGLLLSACATKEYKKQESVFIVFKTPSFKHADLGFIYEGSEGIKVELYGSGQAIMSLEISESLVCMSALKCMDKDSFNGRMLSPYYDKDVLDNIFKAQKIFGGLNFTKTRNGFTQNIIKTNKYNISYSVLDNETIFRDTINDILIKVKRL